MLYPLIPHAVSKAEVDRRIFLVAVRLPKYTVVTSGYDGLDAEIDVSCAYVGNAIVRALRTCAYARPDLFMAQP